MTEPGGLDLAITGAGAGGLARLPLLFFLGGFPGIWPALRAIAYKVR